MARFTIPTRDAAPAASQPILDAVGTQLGMIPNLYRLVSLSPIALTGLANLDVALSKSLDLKTRTRIAIATAQVNGCDYCLSVHTYLGLNFAKISPEDAARNRAGGSTDPKADAAVHFAAKVAQSRGKLTDADITAVKAAGFTEAQIIEIVALVAENFFTNLINNVAQTDIDVPAVHASQAA
jgi:uncharacterized peroxidase-related enzyme